MAVVVQRFHEIGKTRPCAVVSPDEINRNLRTTIVAPLTSVRHGYPSRVPCRFRGRSGEVVLDQIRTIDQRRIVKRVGELDQATARTVLRILREMFA